MQVLQVISKLSAFSTRAGPRSASSSTTYLFRASPVIRPGRRDELYASPSAAAVPHSGSVTAGTRYAVEDHASAFTRSAKNNFHAIISFNGSGALKGGLRDFKRGDGK
ncbi:hypothetical protein EVAR_38337_1 [Eumeta japonica]|uniref:Uncharacterized protein n=1 Tax=Eumeta variegata TaxID=151549 RepID=A0A4C1X5X4_EUMVA|nr:hypothetical protein EVAR_38337_1 [Eumeta japonica]